MIFVLIIKECCFKYYTNVLAYTVLGPGFDPGVQAVSPLIIHLGVSCYYFPPGLWLPVQPQSVTALWPVTSYNIMERRKSYIWLNWHG